MSENSAEKAMPRRDFLKSAGSIATAALLPIPKSIRDLGNEKNPSQEVKVGNLNITPIITEHTEKDWEDHGQEILSELNQFQIIIPEYFPPEYAHLDTGLLERYKALNGLFYHLADYLSKTDKDIWMVDPAYSEAAIAFRPLANLPTELSMGATGLLFGQVAAYAIESSTRPKEFKDLTEDEYSQKLNERYKSKSIKTVQNVARGLGIASAILPGSTVENFHPISIEDNFRELMIAQALTILSKRVNSDAKAAIIYPKAHWDKILEYLNDDKLREETLKRYIEIKKIPIYTPMFETRHYKAENNQWTKLQGFSIDAK